jgi:twinkle protein
LTEKQPCPKCRENGDDRSGDNLVVYPDNRGAHCFACGYHVHGTQFESMPKAEKLKKVLLGKILPLEHRRIDQRTAHLYDYRTARVSDRIVEVANYMADGQLVAQHIRGRADKSFTWRGETGSLPLFGQHLWSGRGKRICITEGEIDCLSLSQMWNNRYPVVSLPNGVSHGPKAVKTNLEFLSGYDEIVLVFDTDDVGRECAERCAELLPAGKVRIAKLPFKDANECLMRNATQKCLQAVYEARSFQPDGILHVSDIVVEDKPTQDIWPYPWNCLTKGLMGQRSGEITLWASGTGSGKSTVIREIAYDHLIRGRRVGMLMLEESPSETLDDLISLQLHKPVRQIRAARQLNTILRAEGHDDLDFGFPDDLTEDEYTEAHNVLSGMPLFIYDHQGTNRFDNILQRMEYMATALEVDVIIVDHVTALVAGMQRSGSEREDIDEIMRLCRSLVERSYIHLHLISQLNRLDGKPAEEGGQISLKNLRGSGSLGSVPNSVLAIERNQQAEDPEERRIVRVRSLKGRFTGETGIAGHLKFDPDTRRLHEAEWHQPENAGSTFAAAEPEPDAVGESVLEGLLDEG